MCLNHLIPYPSNTTVSAYAGLHGGPFDFAAHPIAPAGTKIIIHDKPDTRASWAPHGLHGYYLGPAQAHYRCYRVWANATRSIRVTDTIAWFLQGLQLPSPSAHDLLCATLSDLTQAVQNLHTPESEASTDPTGNVLHTLTSTLKQLADMYSNTVIKDISTRTEAVELLPAPEHRVVIPTSESEVTLFAQEQRVLITPNTPIPHAPPEQEAYADTDPLTVPNTIHTSTSHTDTQSNTLQQITPSLLEAVTTPNTVIAAHPPKYCAAFGPYRQSDTA